VRERRDAFHLAIPAYDLADTEDFYVRQLGCKVARRYGDRITLYGRESRAGGEYALYRVLRDDPVRESADDGCGAV
jgi:catechol 2,3-dioxygenase-like lactoylglutathione lyase family enzyme